MAHPSHILPLFLAMMTLLAPACSRGTMATSELDGVRYQIDGSGMRLESSQGVVTAGNEAAVVTVRDGRLHRGQQDLGPVPRGDLLHLTDDGRVLVNGVRR